MAFTLEDLERSFEAIRNEPYRPPFYVCTPTERDWLLGRGRFAESPAQPSDPIPNPTPQQP